MKKLFLSLLILSGVCAYAQDTTKIVPAVAASYNMDDYELDINKSKVLWNIGTTRGVQAGEIKFKEGSLIGNEEMQKLGPATFSIDMTSITCNSVPLGIVNTQIVLTLKTDNFFDAYRFPYSYLKFIKVSGPNDENLYEIDGLMTIKGRENAVSFTASGRFHDDIFEGVAKNISIERALFGIAFAKPGVKDEAVQQINASLNPKYNIDVYIVAEKK
jgi:polyisoprenoid-binding protein YceI